ncbi:hypothetical protein FQR65_LT03655 [Abscondita terminalis]|nr:hypothetical protein FQR65_LT03655 [Abscondita terminalis]
MCNNTFAYLILILTITLKANSSIYQNYAKLFNPQDYLGQLPSLSLPYKNNIPIPSVNIPLIKPSRVVTKVINVVTEYVSKNPVCIKIKGKKQPCGYKNATSYNIRKKDIDHDIRKEYYVLHRNDDENKRRGNKMIKGDLFGSEYLDVFEQPYETPTLENKIKTILIDQQLDKLEDILPHYTRIKHYETETITVTKQLLNNRVMATLMVKNCVPQDVNICPPSRGKNLVGNETEVIDVDRHVPVDKTVYLFKQGFP